MHLNNAVFSINIMMPVIRKQHANHYRILKMVQRRSQQCFLFHYHSIYIEISYAINNKHIVQCVGKIKASMSPKGWRE